MKSASKRQAVQAEPAVQGELRRSARERKQPKNDDYFMGSDPLEDVLDCAYYEEEHPKRRRHHYRIDDSEDYSEGHRRSRRSKLPNSNKVEALLDWRTHLEMLPITINCLPGQSEPALEQLTRVVTTKSIAGENLSALAEDVLAIFVNIEWGRKGQSLREFEQVKLESMRLMRRGIVFVWTPKEHVSQMLTIMEQKHFQYVENFEIINLDIDKARLHARANSKKIASEEKMEKLEDKTQYEEIDLNQLIRSLNEVDPCALIADSTSEYFNASKRTLLMFKKSTNEKFELRHQRTCDVVFDMPLQPGHKCQPDLKAYIYNMIQTLLPEGLLINLNSKGEPELRMMELWADRDEYRRGWVSVVQE